MATSTEHHWLTAREVCARFRFSRTTLWARVRSGDLPQPHHRGRVALWRSEDIKEAETRLITPPRAA